MGGVQLGGRRARGEEGEAVSHHTCEFCGDRFRDEHSCDRDPSNMAAEIASLRSELDALRAAHDDLSAVVTELVAAFARGGQGA